MSQASGGNIERGGLAACAVWIGALNLLSQVGASAPVHFHSGGGSRLVLCWLKTENPSRTLQVWPMRGYHCIAVGTTTVVNDSIRRRLLTNVTSSWAGPGNAS